MAKRSLQRKMGVVGIPSIACDAAIVAFAIVAGAPSSMALAGSARGGSAPKPRIYVYTAQSVAATSDDERGRLDSVRDLQEILQHKSQFTLVSTADEAQVVLEVVNREERDVPEGGFGGKSISKFRETIVRLRVTAGQERGEVKGVGQASWTSAAKDAVKRLSKWLKNHKIGDGSG